MKIYIASKFENKEVVRGLMTYLIQQGHTITKDWTVSGPPSELEAIEDVVGVTACDVFIGLFDENVQYKGAIFELGLAYAWNKAIILVGNAMDNMVFIHLESIIKLPDRKALLDFIESGRLEKL